MVEGQVKEEGLARDGLEAWWEVHQAGLLGDKGRVQAKGLKPLHQRLEDRSRRPSEGPQRTFAVLGMQPARVFSQPSVCVRPCGHMPEGLHSVFLPNSPFIIIIIAPFLCV